MKIAEDNGNNLDNFDTYFIDKDKKLYSIVPLGKPDIEDREQYTEAHYTNEGLALDVPSYRKNEIERLKGIQTLISDELGPLIHSEDIQDNLWKVQDMLEEHEKDLRGKYRICNPEVEGLDKTKNDIVEVLELLEKDIESKVSQQKLIEGKVFTKSPVIEKKTISDRDFVQVDIGQCHVVVIKSEEPEPRYWVLHYDPNQTTKAFNEFRAHPDMAPLRYQRPNYSDCNPKLPYELESANLQRDVPVSVKVFVADQEYGDCIKNGRDNFREVGTFDERALKTTLGEERIQSLDIVQLQKKFPKDSPDNTYSVTFFPKIGALNDELIVYQNVGLQKDLNQAQEKGLTKVIIKEEDFFNKTVGEESINLKKETVKELSVGKKSDTLKVDLDTIKSTLHNSKKIEKDIIQSSASDKPQNKIKDRSKSFSRPKSLYL